MQSVGNPGERKADAYEELLMDVIQGDRSLFLRYDEVKAAWNVVDPFMHAWAEDERPPLAISGRQLGAEGSGIIFSTKPIRHGGKA
jgi:glucose-6-phosphate 1-dehydrogenase